MSISSRMMSAEIWDALGKTSIAESLRSNEELENFLEMTSMLPLLPETECFDA